jgi:putative FmdB family regulatory protein
MPIYEYACPDCGYQHDHLQKLADAPIAACPKCGSTTYYKKISAAGFALKGTGWYVTDFRNGNTGQKPGDKKGTDDAVVAPASSDAKSTDSASTKADSAASPATAPAAAPSPTPAPAPAPVPASTGK